VKCWKRTKVYALIKRVKIMDYIKDVTGGKGGSAYLVLGKDKTALIDCGMAYCAGSLIDNIQEVIGGRKLNYILLSHSHYDHVGAVPYLRKAWPEVEVLAAEYAQKVLSKKSALKTIRDLSCKAGEHYGAYKPLDYDDEMMKVDSKVYDGDLLDLGVVKIAVIETPGHTKCSLSFLVNEKVMFASETSGVISSAGKIYPTFITSYRETIESNKKCQEAKPEYIVSPHSGLVSRNQTHDFWQNCIKAAVACRDFVLQLFSSGADEDEIFERYKEAYYDKTTSEAQPDYAFELNNRAMIRTIIKETKESA
jgi:glyoxylase-like metal-dependent hydrolase (beta-lactamase superfamily II)